MRHTMGYVPREVTVPGDQPDSPTTGKTSACQTSTQPLESDDTMGGRVATCQRFGTVLEKTR